MEIIELHTYSGNGKAGGDGRDLSVQMCSRMGEGMLRVIGGRGWGRRFNRGEGSLSKGKKNGDEIIVGSGE